MKQYFVYILKCSDNSYYTGVTSNLENRILDHQSGKYPESYTHNKRPIELVFYYEFNEIEQAIAFEKQVKGWSRKKKEAIINDNWGNLKKLSICKNQSHSDNIGKDGKIKGFDSVQSDITRITFSKNKEEMDVPYIHSYLTKSYWNEGISLEKIQKCIDNSLNFGMFLDGKQIGYARVLTDFVRFSYLMDVFIEPTLQGNGYGKSLMKYIFEDKEIQQVPGMLLATKDAHTLYEKFGFKRFSDENKNRFMILKKEK